MAKFLHIETSTKVCSVAISTDGILVDVIESASEKYIHSEKLTVYIQTLCSRNEWMLSDLDAIVVTSGPGSYTGLRIGVSTAKGLCYALDLPLISVNAVETIAYLAHKKYPHQQICAMIDARRMEAFSAIYSTELECIKPLSADVLDENSYVKFRPFVACGDGAIKVKSLWKDKGITIDETIVSSATGQIEKAYLKFKANAFEDVAYFEPKYLKDFVATKSSKKLF